MGCDKYCVFLFAARQGIRFQNEGSPIKIGPSFGRLWICGQYRHFFQIGITHDDYYEVAAKLQEALSWWEQCTTVSGGAIVPEKSWYGLVHFDWVDGEWEYSTDMTDISIEVKNMKGKASQLQSLDPHEVKEC